MSEIRFFIFNSKRNLFLAVAVAAAEFINTSGCIDKFLLAGEEWV